MSFRVLGTGKYVPSKVVTNDELSTLIDTSDEWIVKRVGVKERRICTTESASDLAYQAALNALENANVKPEELDMILCTTVSGETVSPSMSSMVQKYLGATCPAMDINAACSAFIFMLETAAGYFARKKVKKMLVIGTEQMSRIVDWDDRATCVIFGDGAGALVLGEGDNFLNSKLNSFGGNEVINIPNFVGKSPFYKKEAQDPYIFMNGQETFKFAVNAMCKDLQYVVDDLGLTFDDISMIVPHQANTRIIDFAVKRLKVERERIYVNIDKYGNTSSASIPIALDELNRAGKLKHDDLIAMTAFGGGLSSAACILRW
ncbi:ketoacyl-ACP synthase III [Sedimentibacter sp. zth1]|uniref:beta-ketoacyl-ACP synthase III n=1 Tax=Sedimentibacter sp. zth1 TaxID=2816908 RepID=UPI001A92D025|nr:beta-ketoacyl-ACP synthase III [Sedimentibacter sp. zth1]QSX05542.1 ketoacyl-ACP synthase III [Sedimentibacter sp. zth1]